MLKAIMDREEIGMNSSLFTFPLDEDGAYAYEIALDKFERGGKGTVEVVYISNKYAFVMHWNTVRYA